MESYFKYTCCATLPKTGLHCWYFPSESYEIFQNSIFTEHPWTNAFLFTLGEVHVCIYYLFIYLFVNLFTYLFIYFFILYSINLVITKHSSH